ncbi:MAG: mobile mystery protein A [Candidatus Aceula meridiana]|nr:mobile mystery protein A [Candidatus Aceula meridiana]
MKNKNLQSTRKQIDAKLVKIKRLGAMAQRPSKGWIYVIRTSLGLNVRQFAELMGVDKSRISRMEKDEIRGSLTIHSLRHAAQILGCELVYAFVPLKNLEDVVRKRAGVVVQQQHDRSSHTMALEGQELDQQQKKSFFKAEIEQLCRETPKYLWERS